MPNMIFNSPRRTVLLILGSILFFDVASHLLFSESYLPSLAVDVLRTVFLTAGLAGLTYQLVYKPMTYRIKRLHVSYNDLLLYKAAVQETYKAVLITDACKNIIFANQATTDLTGYSEAELLGNNPKMLSAGISPAGFYTRMWEQIESVGLWHGELTNKKKSGEEYIQRASITMIPNTDGVTVNYVAVFHDITERCKEAEKLQYYADHDNLTGLPNRKKFLDTLESIISDSRRSDKRTAVLFLDLDGFKPVNDTYGHHVGDELLIAVSKSLKNLVRKEDTVSRLGGDEFTIILRNLAKRKDAGLLATKILKQLGQPFDVDGQKISVGASIGIAVFPDNADTLQGLVDQADAAMYMVKKSGKNKFKYFPKGKKT